MLDCAARLPDPDDDRRAALGDRHRRHGPPRPAQRAGDVGTRRRSGRGRAHAAARQDRHDHAGQPPGDRVHPAARRERRRRSPTPRSWPRCPTKPPKAARSWCWRRRSTACAGASCRRSTATFVPFTAQTRMSGVDLHGPQRPGRQGRVPIAEAREIRKGAAEAVERWVTRGGRADELRHRRANRARRRHAAGRRRTAAQSSA